ncbi:MAG: HAMP domain-containing histidine kinase [Clostridia bacterium]|nr:HAMP domain-containing histidine kinase [Clostridia bacterium]
MKKARRSFVAYAMAAMFVLLTVLLGTVNAVSLTMASRDADKVTEMLASRNGVFAPGAGSMRPPGTDAAPDSGDVPRDFSLDDRFGPMGPSSPELDGSLRYFTAVYDGAGSEGELVAYNISAVSEEEALLWGGSLLRESTGWTHGTYRYRVYGSEGRTFVTVIDQGREMVGVLRLLTISALGEVLGLLLSFLFLLWACRRVFRPLEAADRKQNEFIAGMEREFKLPLTVIAADGEVIEREHGSSPQTQSIRRQVRHMTGLLARLGAFAVFPKDGDAPECDLSAAVGRTIEELRGGTELEISANIEPGVKLAAPGQTVDEILAELRGNALKFATGPIAVTLTGGQRVKLIFANGAKGLADGPCDVVFDRFATLDNAVGGRDAGLGLSRVKELVRDLGGRCSAEVSNGVFSVTIAF